MGDFEPYASNGGTILGISGDDFAIIASDTRLSEGYSIYSRTCSKVYELTGETVLGCAGFHGDALTLVKQIKRKIANFAQIHQKTMSTGSAAQLLSTMLYGKRFFPYYTYNILGGIDADGKGAVYSFDPVGSYERERYRAAGTASALLQPLLDNQIGLKNMEDPDTTPLSLARAVNLVKDVFTAAAERDIYTGDSVTIAIITKDGVTYDSHALRRD